MQRFGVEGFWERVCVVSLGEFAVGLGVLAVSLGATPVSLGLRVKRFGVKGLGA